MLLLPTVLACRELPTATGDAIAPSLKPGTGGPSYTVLTPPVAPGWTAFMPRDINSLHLAIGVMNPAGTTSQMARRAATWVAGGSAVPVVLPVLADRVWSQANGVSENGIVAGAIFPSGVLWVPTGSGYEIRLLAENGGVSDVQDDGTAVGTMKDPVQPDLVPPMPVLWNASGVPDTLPFPASGKWNGGEALAINANGDISGTFEEWTFGHSYVWGALWIRENGGYTPIVMQTGWARGLSDRTADGRIHVTASAVWSKAYRHTFTRNASGAWTSDSVLVEGTSEDMNAAGDFVGTVRKSFSSGGYPFVYPTAGTQLKLPIPRGSSGSAVGVSNDGWIAGAIDGVGVIWKP
jgi:hypothetical protein